jgi:mono/diheme cytochrome c family protein
MSHKRPTERSRARTVFTSRRALVLGCALGALAACSRSERASQQSASTESASTESASAAAAAPSGDSSGGAAAPVESTGSTGAVTSAPTDSSAAPAATPAHGAPTADSARTATGEKGKTAAASSTPRAVSKAAQATSSTSATKPRSGEARSAATTQPAPGTSQNTVAAGTDTARTASASNAAATDSTQSSKSAPSAGTPASASSDTAGLCETINGPKGVQPQKPGADPLLVSQSEYDGWKMFAVYCYRCHGEDAMGGGVGPNLRHSVGPEGTVNHACFVYTVTNGRPAKGMPTWKVLLDQEQIENIWHYLQARSSGRLIPGRPHTAAAKSGE